VETGLGEIVEYAVLTIEGMAIVIIAFASIQAFVRVVRIAFSRAPVGPERSTYIEFLRWLVAGLTFQLAADVINTTIAPGWDEIGRLGAIAAIRTFLNYFAERDMHHAIEMSEAARLEEPSSRVTAGPARAGSPARPEPILASRRE
jgi:uncharacterized membrane protein